MISKKLIFLTLIVVLIGYFLSTRVQTGVCPVVKTMQKFEPQKYMGKWYEIQKYPMIWQTGQKCTTATYGLNPNGTVNVDNQAIFKYIDYPVGIQGLATPSPSESSKLVVSFGSFFPKGDYWLIDTDYTSYSLVYSCCQLTVPYFNLPFRLEYSWILSRKPTLDQNRVNSLTKTLANYKSNTNLFRRTDQKDCPKK